MDSSHQQARGDWPQGGLGSLPTGGPQSLEAEGKAIPCLGGIGQTEGGQTPPGVCYHEGSGSQEVQRVPSWGLLRGPHCDRAAFNCVVPCSWGPRGGGDPCTDSKREGAVPRSVPPPSSEGSRAVAGVGLSPLPG